MAAIKFGALPLDALRGVTTDELQPGDLLWAREYWWLVLANRLLQLTSNNPALPSFRLFPRNIDDAELYSVVRLPGPPALRIHSNYVGGECAAAGMIAITHGGPRVVATDAEGARRSHVLNLADWTLAPRNGVTASAAIERWECVWTSPQGAPALSIRQGLE